MSDPRAAAIRRYAAAYNEVYKDEQVALVLGEYERSEEAHAIGVRLVRAIAAEMDDLDPQDSCHCALCLLAQFRRVV
jgi:hypothetical protein